MDKITYDDKLQALSEIFQGDGQYAKKVLDQWLHTKKAEFEAEIIDEVNRRLEGLSSILPVTLRLIIDSNGIQLPATKAAGPSRKAKTRRLEVAEAANK